MPRRLVWDAVALFAVAFALGVAAVLLRHGLHTMVPVPARVVSHHAPPVQLM